jgi:tRNA threonylcarbamoyl adenosine modification protein (Sua5/YciO/YrdC/YwlC family)
MAKHINIYHPKVVNYAANSLEEGGVIVYPTDTLYGFGADATNDEAIDKIHRIKGRSGPMSVMAADKNMAVDWMEITGEQIEIVKPYLGGAQTLIIPVKDNIVCTKILGDNNTLGIRIPDNHFCNELSFQLGKPIISTSVNRTGEQPINDPFNIKSRFGSEVDLLIDAGTLPESKGSTIYQLKDNNIIILRK